MKERLLWWIIKKCLLIIDKDGTLMAHSISVDETTSYNVLVERYYSDHWTFGTQERTY